MTEAVVQVRAKPVSDFSERPLVRGKFLYVGNEKFWVKGVSYGTFLIGENGEEQLDREVVRRDFALMAKHGFNVVRVHTGPPRWLLDQAQENGLRVMVGLNWGEQMAFLDDSKRVEEITDTVRRWVRRCAGHPAVFCYTVGNEITSSIVRWHGRKRVEKFVQHLYRIAKEEDPEALVTYVNYPSTEYLRLPFLDFLCFNVYLESQQAFEDYLGRLHSLSNDTPVLLSEVGLDSLRNGEDKQARTLDWQVRSTFKLGCCGLVVFAWTDEWYHGTHLVEDWKFGLTTRTRTAKPALHVVQKAFAESTPPPRATHWPRVSVVVCSYNGSATIRDTLEGLRNLDYPDFEVIVVNDGSTDSTPDIVSEYPSVKLVATENRGLSNARNTGIETADGDLVAFIDDDAYPDSLWLKYLVLSLSKEENCVGVGGPNLPPPSEDWRIVAMGHAPGGPNPVLVSDRSAEHVPGCNMLFRKEALVEVGGFDPRFRTAGDDVDLCWRLIDKGGRIAYSQSAVVWHHRRSSTRRYWKQQVGYGKAEALLEKKWPNKYNSLGQMKWLGRIYGRGVPLDFASLFTGRVYQGVWGSAPYQSLYQPRGSIWSLLLMPEWYLFTGTLGALFLLSLGWLPWLVFGPPMLLAITLPALQATANVRRTRIPTGDKMRWSAFKVRTMLVFLNIVQPLARLDGRFRGGLTPWRRHGPKARQRFRSLTMSLWRDRHEPPETMLRKLQDEAQEAGVLVRAGNDFDNWDLEIRTGLFGGGRLLLAVEEHAPGKQLLRFRISPVYSSPGVVLSSILATMSVAAALSGAWIAGIVSGLGAALIIVRATQDSASAVGVICDLSSRVCGS